MQYLLVLFQKWSLLNRVISLFVFTYFFCQHSVVKTELIHDPTVKPYSAFDCNNDVTRLHNILDNFEVIGHWDAVAKIIFHRSYEQRKQIQQTYANTYSYYAGNGKYEDDKITRYLGRHSCGSMGDLYDMMFVSFQDTLARVVRKVIKGDWKEEGAIEEIICANDNEMKKLIQKAYQDNYKITVDEDLKTFNKDDVAYQTAIGRFGWPLRCQDKKLSKEQATQEAKSLQDIDITKDGEKFKCKLKDLLGKYCEPDLKLIFQCYRKDDEHGIDTTVNEVFKGDELRVYAMIVRYIESTCGCYADELHKSVKGFGRDIDKINRIVVTRSERDLMCILKNFQTRKKRTFTDRLKEEVPTEQRYLESIRYLCGKP